MKSRKRTRSPEEHVRPPGRAGTLRTEVGVTVSPHVEDPEEPVFNPPERENTANTATQSAPITLTEFLRMRLPYLEENPLHTKSTATRAPQFYDRHLADALRLKKVAFIDKRFFEVLSKICDHYIKQLLENGEAKAILSSFPDFVPPSREHIKNENSLVSYCEDINKYISLIASALLFRTNCNAAFGFSAQPDLTASDDAAADAYFFARRGVDFLLPAEHGPNFDLVHKYDLQIPINWEYKNLGFGSQIFFALQTQGGDFHWTACQERSGRHGATSKCPNHIHRTEGRLTITGRPTGPDASATVDIIKRSTDENVLDSEEERPTKRVRKNAKTAAEKKVQSILQQAWTSAVVQDASFIVISTGNEECFAIRHRETQRLLISPPIRPSDKTGPSYVKVCIGLFIVAYQDAVDRAQQLDSKCLSLYAQALLRLRIDDRPALPNASSSGLFDTHRVAVQVLPPESYFLDLLAESRRIDLRLHGHVLATVQYDRNTWTLSRDGPGNTTATPESNMNNKVVFLDLDHFFSKTGRTFKVYFGVVDSADNKTDYFEKPLVLKMARGAVEVADLKTEYEWYGRLKNAGVTSIVECYGIFSCQVNRYDERYFLLLEDGGVPVSNRSEAIRLLHTNKYRDLYTEALTEVHQASFTHTNIREEHVLMDVNRQKVSFISLKGCRKPDEDVAASLRATDIINMGLCLGFLSEGGSPTEDSDPVPSPDIGEGSRSETPSGAFVIVD